MVYMYHSFLIHLSADGHRGCFHVLAMINSAAMNIWVHMSLSDLVSSVCAQEWDCWVIWPYFLFFKPNLWVLCHLTDPPPLTMAITFVPALVILLILPVTHTNCSGLEIALLSYAWTKDAEGIWIGWPGHHPLKRPILFVAVKLPVVPCA